MPIDVAVLATTIVTSFLLPYVKLGGEKIAEKVAEKFGEATADKATDVSKSVWGRVKAAFSSERDQHTFAEFEEEPEAALSLVEAKLKKKLEQDPALAQELDQLVNSPGPDGVSTGAQIMNASVAGILDARGANFSNANNLRLAGVMIGQDQADKVTKTTQDVEEEK